METLAATAAFSNPRAPLELVGMRPSIGEGSPPDREPVSLGRERTTDRSRGYEAFRENAVLVGDVMVVGAEAEPRTETKKRNRRSAVADLQAAIER